MNAFFADLSSYLVVAVFFLIPIASVIWFAICLFRFCKAKKIAKQDPERYNESDLKGIKTVLIISAAVAGILVAIIISLIILFSLAIAYM